jgi:hypothetical protein
MSTVRVVNIQHTDATEPNIVLEADGTTVFASGITISGGTNLTVSGTAEFASGTVSAPSITFIDDNNTGIYEPAVDTVAITTAATERLRVDSSGNVGIGVTTVNADLHIGSAQPTIRLQDTTTNCLAQITSHDNGNIYLDADLGNTRASSSIRFLVDTSERMRIDSSGNVGIGTTSPDSKLHVVDTNLNGIRVGYLSGTSNLNIYDADEHAFRGRGSGDKVRIDSLGNVGIGTTSPANSSGYNTLTLGNGTSIGGQLLLKNASGNNFWIWHDSNGANIYNSAATSQIFYTNSAERMRILPTGGLTFNGDTATANALDDYEEGSWTPTIANLSLGNGTITGHYTKIGNIVHVSFHLDGGSTTTFTSTMNSISNLPYTNALAGNSGLLTASNPSNNWLGYTQQYSTGTSTNYIQWVTSSNIQAVGSGSIPFTWGVNTDMRFNMTYRVA